MDHLTKIGPDSSVLTEVDISQYTEVVSPCEDYMMEGYAFYIMYEGGKTCRKIYCGWIVCQHCSMFPSFFAGCLVCYTEMFVSRIMKYYYRTPWRGRGTVTLYTAFFY